MDEVRAEVKAILENRQPTISSSRPGSRHAMPANTGIFHGRDTLVGDLVQTLTSIPEGQKGARVCLLGPGGMGKTSTALAVMAHPEMRKHFSERNQVWVPCVKATSVSLFLDTLYSSLGISRNTGNALEDILSALKSSAEPLVLLLDNFETPWNVDGGRAETERILRDLENIAHVTIFITMRSSVAPCHGINWFSVDLTAVDVDAARRIYSDIYTEAGKEPKLPELLHLVGCMPLAITLMATIGKITGLKAEELIEEYKRIGTAMLGLGSDSGHSMEVCISLSVDSPPMRSHPEAGKLLAILAMLPVGATHEMLATCWARHLSDLPGALQILRETSLVEQRKSKFFVLPVIRSYILAPSRFPHPVRIAMVESACYFLAQHKSSSGDASFKSDAVALAGEESNLQAILLDTTVPESSLIEALIVLARYQAATRARLEVIEHSLDLARRMKSTQMLLADALDCHAWMLRHLGRYSESLAQFNLAHQTFLTIPDEKRAAQCLLGLIEVHSFEDADPKRDSELVKKAMGMFNKIQDAHGIAISLYYYGRVYGQSGLFMEAVEMLTWAREMLGELGDSLHRAHCSHHLLQVYLWYRKYQEAEVAGALAVEEYERLGHYTGDTTLILGHVLIEEGNSAAALRMLVRSLGTSKFAGRPLAVAQTLEMMGRAWDKVGEKGEARTAFAEAVQIYGPSGTNLGKEGMIRCQFLTRVLEDPASIPSDEELFELARFWHDFAMKPSVTAS